MGNDKVLLRRLENDLYISGTGVLIMGVWNIIKAVMQAFLIQSYQTDIVRLSEQESVPMMIFALSFTTLILVILFLLHIYIGLNAVREAKGREFKKGYLKADVFMLVIDAAGMIMYKDYIVREEIFFTTLASILVDVTTIYIFVIVLRSARRIRKLKTQQEQGGS